MSQKLKHQAPSDNVAQMPSHCKAEGCKSGSHQMSFCTQHFAWFKFGLVNKQGQKVPDFDKKWDAFQKRKAA